MYVDSSSVKTEATPLIICIMFMACQEGMPEATQEKDTKSLQATPHTVNKEKKKRNKTHGQTKSPGFVNTVKSEILYAVLISFFGNKNINN